MEDDIVKQILTPAIDLAVQVIKAANEAIAFKKECEEIKIKVEKLLELLEKAVMASSNLLEFPTRHIISVAKNVLHKSLSLFHNCIPCVVSIIHVSTYQKILVQLESSINEVLWLLNVSIPSSNREQDFLNLPPTTTYFDSSLPRSANPFLFFMYQRLAILYTGTLDESCKAATSLRSMATLKPRYAEIMICNGLCPIFARILKQGSMRVQAEVACTTSVLVSNFPESQNVFAQHDVIQFLLRLLASSEKTPKLEDFFHMKAMVAKALKELAKGNSTILMVLIEITTIAEQDSDLRHSAFNYKSPLFKAIVNQIHKLIVEKGDTVLLIPYITLVGNIARAFRASDTSMIEQLVKLLGHQDPEVSREAILALTKFVSPSNYLHKDHSRAIVEAGAARRLIELSSLGCEVRIPALELLILSLFHSPITPT